MNLNNGVGFGVFFKILIYKGFVISLSSLMDLINIYLYKKMKYLHENTIYNMIDNLNEIR